MKLGEFLPQHIKDKLANDNLKLGSILRVFVHDTKPPKTKMYIIVGFTTDKLVLGTVYINTEINPNIFNTPELRNEHLPIYKKNNDFLNYDSYIDCTQIQEREFEKVKQVLQNTPQCHLGDLKEIDLHPIFHKLQTSKFISPIQKKKFQLDLKE